MSIINEIVRGSDGWPSSLDELGPLSPPTRLFVTGRALPTKENCIAIVGTRRPTAAGLEAAEVLACGLVEAGFVIVSGLAMGIDAAAHRAALRGGGHTVAVVGCGLDVPYPLRNLRLKEQIGERGTLVSEYDIGVQPLKQHFPMRNRIIVGLSEGVIVVEGGPTSGALVTARLALDANRHVWAVPGSFRNPMSSGPNELIRTGQAALITDVRHVLDDLAPRLVWKDNPSSGATSPVGLEESEKQVLELMDDVPLNMERICAQLGVAPGRAALALARLEVRGLVVRRSGSYEISTAGARIRDSVS